MRPNTPSAEHAKARWMRLTAVRGRLARAPPSRWPSCDGDARPSPRRLTHSSATDHQRARPQRAARHRSHSHCRSPFRCLRGELTGSRWKVRYAARCAAIRPGGRRPPLVPPFPLIGTTGTRQFDVEGRYEADRGGPAAHSRGPSPDSFTGVDLGLEGRVALVTAPHGASAGRSPRARRRGCAVAISSRSEERIQAAARRSAHVATCTTRPTWTSHPRWSSTWSPTLGRSTCS